MCLIRTHILMYRYARCVCKLWHLPCFYCVFFFLIFIHNWRPFMPEVLYLHQTFTDYVSVWYSQFGMPICLLVIILHNSMLHTCLNFQKLCVFNRSYKLNISAFIRKVCILIKPQTFCWYSCFTPFKCTPTLSNLKILFYFLSNMELISVISFDQNKIKFKFDFILKINIKIKFSMLIFTMNIFQFPFS